MNAVDVVREFVAARAARDAEQIARLLADELVWVTPRKREYDKEAITPYLLEEEGYDELLVTRENHRFEELADGRVLALFEQVYAWRDGSGLANRVPAGAVFEVRDGKIARAQHFLSAEKARAAL